VALDTDLKMSSKTSFPWFYFYRIARISFLIFLPSLFLILFFYRSSYKEGLFGQIRLETEESLRTIDATIKQGHLDWKDWCSQLHPQNVRYTLSSLDGRILCDTQSTASRGVIKDKTELTGAIENEFFSQVRYSDFFQTQSLFAALKVSNDLILRKVVPITSLKDNMGRFDRIIFYRIVPVALISYLLFLFLFYRATRPLSNILGQVQRFEFEHPVAKNIERYYQKNEWHRIEDALSLAETQIKQQLSKSKSEDEKVRTILESIHDKIVAIDPFETILFCNDKFQNSFFKNSYEGITPKIWHAIKDEKVLETFRHVIRSGQTVSLSGLNHLTHSQDEKTFDLTVSALKNAEGVITGALGVFYDVTEFKRTEQMRVDFVANISHEIRTPLTSIKGYAQLLSSQKTKIDPSLHSFMEKINSNTERMIALFTDLLNLSVIESQKNISFEDIALNEVFTNVGQSIMTNYPQKKVHLSSDLQLETIKGVPRLMEQVLANLIDNSCKYSGDSISIKVSSFKKEDKAFIIVSDNGPGMAKEHLQRIFERFYRVDSSRESSRGTGLGLSIVKHIVAKHGGRIWAESEENKGTDFIIELPID
jgi:two-component system phosphate regulon sensor histidine kinase PhoR